MTPYIIEERQLNVAQMDVFSRLMMDRIIFLGMRFMIKLPILFRPNCYFLQSADASSGIFRFISIHRVVRFMPV